MKLNSVTKEQFQAAISPDKGDNFAKTFIAKCNMMELWDQVMGAWNEEGELMGAVITTISKTNPRCANLQLLHTFVKHRRLGVGSVLCEWTLNYAVDKGCVYFRVSAEESAVAFYRSLGVKFWGAQKSGCKLSLFQIGGKEYSEGVYQFDDPFIQKKLFTKAKGGLHEVYELPS